MPVRRLIVVADPYDLATLVSKLVEAGVNARDIHVSHDAHDHSLASQGVRFDMPCGRLSITSDTPSPGCNIHYARTNRIDDLVP